MILFDPEYPNLQMSNEKSKCSFLFVSVIFSIENELHAVIKCHYILTRRPGHHQKVFDFVSSHMDQLISIYLHQLLHLFSVTRINKVSSNIQFKSLVTHKLVASYAADLSKISGITKIILGVQM